MNIRLSDHPTTATEQFLTDLCGPDAQIYFNVDGTTWKNRPSTYDEIKDTLNWLNTVKYKDIYFIPNSGGTKDVEITCFNAAYIDWDAGRDPQGHYFPLDVVAQKKAEFLTSIQSSPIQPSYIIETRNGFHIYWLLYPGTTPEQFISLQKALSAYFHSDHTIINPARVMRLPGYYWYKSQNNCSPFYVDIIHSSPRRYSYLDICNSFHFETDPHHLCFDDNALLMSDQGRKSAHNNISSIYLIDKNIIGGTYRQDSQESVVLGTMEDVVEFLCRQDLARYLGYNQLGKEENKFISCPFHKDKTPSASIYIHEGRYFLKCHSSRCRFKSGTLIQVVARKEKISETKAIRILMDHYQIELDSSWKEETKAILKRNIERICHSDDWKEKYPDLFRCITRVQKDLVSKLEYAKEHISLRSIDGTPLFFCSLREFERHSSKYPYTDEKGRQNQRIDRYCLLGMLRKVHPDQIPWGLWIGLQEVRGKKRYQYWTQVYSVPEYTDDLFQKANSIAQQIKDAGARMNAISRDMIFDVFGEQKAIEVYPQNQAEQISDRSQLFRQEVGTILNRLIEEKGYTTVSELVEQVHKNRAWISVTDRRVKKHLPWLLKEHNLVETITTKILKERYKIDSKGYPKIIINNDKAIMNNHPC